MNIQDLVPIDYSNQRVITTKQLAEVYGTTASRIRDNFRYAKKHFVEGVDYFKVTDDDLRALKEAVEEVWFSHANHKPSPLAGATRAIMLWTEKGCVRHCKMLNTQAAWDMFNELERVYFEVKETVPADVDNHDLRDLQRQIDDLKEQFAGVEFAFNELLNDTLAPAEKVAALLGVAILIPNPDRQRILLQAVNLIVGRKIF